MQSSRLVKNSKGKQERQASDIAKRDMSGKQKVIRKVKELSDDGKVHLTASWNIECEAVPYKISFSRDNLHVWVNGKAVGTTGYITDKGYDVDLFFDLDGSEGHIYSDVEGHEMMNYLLIDGEIKAQDYQIENSHTQ